MNKPFGGFSRYQKDWHQGDQWCTPPSAGALPEELLARLVSGAFGPALRLSSRTDAAVLEGRAAVSSSVACTACTLAGDVAAPAPVMLASGSTCICTSCLLCLYTHVRDSLASPLASLTKTFLFMSYCRSRFMLARLTLVGRGTQHQRLQV